MYKFIFPEKQKKKGEKQITLRYSRGIPLSLSSAAGILRERLGFRTKGFFAYHRKSPARPKSNSEIVPIATQLRFHSHPSLGSDNTISNSSLQDLDETEFTGSELAEYMGELNFNLIT